MTDQAKTNTEIPFDFASCLAMMEKMMGEHGASCDCSAMMFQAMGQEDIPEEWRNVMSQIMELCRGSRVEEEETI